METRSILARVAALMLAGGLIAGPGYYLYCTQFSGKQVGKFELSRSAQAGKFSSVEVELDPSMNPVGMGWSGQVAPEIMFGHSIWNSYKATLYLGERRIMADDFSLSLGEKDRSVEWKWVSLGSASVPATGRYRLGVEELAKPQFRVSGMQIEFRRNVLPPNIAIAISGSGVAIAGFLLIFVVGWWPEIRAYYSRGGNAAGAVPDPRPDGATEQMKALERTIGWGSRGAMILIGVFVLLMVALFVAKSQGYLP
jgi:hypothetical protein